MRFLLLSLFTLFSFNLHAKSLEINVDCRSSGSTPFSDYLIIDGVITLSDTQGNRDPYYDIYNKLNGVLDLRIPYSNLTVDSLVIEGRVDAVIRRDGGDYYIGGTVGVDNPSDGLYNLIRFSKGQRYLTFAIEIIYNFKKYECMFDIMD